VLDYLDSSRPTPTSNGRRVYETLAGQSNLRNTLPSLRSNVLLDLRPLLDGRHIARRQTDLSGELS
jgi:hypothetical protein